MFGDGRAKTKKVTTYGRSATRIVPVLSDMSPARHAPASPALKTPAQRPALASKPSQDGVNVNIPLMPYTPTVDEIVKSKLDNVLVYDISSASPVIAPCAYARGRKFGRAGIPASPISPQQQAKPQMQGQRSGLLQQYRSSPSTVGRRERMESVEIITKSSTRNAIRPRRAIREVSLETESESASLADKLANITIDDVATSSLRATRDSAGSSNAFLLAELDGARTEALDQLKAACTSPDVLSYDQLLNALGNMLKGSPVRSSIKMEKMGEATYSEVYGAHFGEDNVVVKIIPLAGCCNGKVEDLPSLSRPEDVLKEVQISERLSGISGGGFIKYYGSYIVKDVYNAKMLAAWDEYKAQWTSENTRPSCFAPEQLYLVLCLSDGGYDLESTAFDKDAGWRQAASVFWQVSRALAAAEDELEFEHRDLHEGQILIFAEDQTPGVIKDYSDPACSGVRASLIDFGLSRLRNADGSIHTAIPGDILDGEGAQWDVYRAMHAEAKDDWETYRPQTNLRWLLYIANYILNECPSLEKPKSPTSRPGAKPTKSTINKRLEVEAYETLVTAKKVMESHIVGASTSKRGGRRAVALESEDVLQGLSAGGLTGWARAKRWVA